MTTDPTQAEKAADAAAPPRLLIGIAAALAVGLAVVVAVIGLSSGDDGERPPQQVQPLPLAAVDAPDAESPDCARLTGKLPDSVASGGGQLQRRELVDPAPAAAAAWGSPDPVVLRCGVRKPQELKPTSELVQTDGVRWFQAAGPGTSTWYAVDRAVYVALTVPENAGTGVVQDISKAVDEALTPRRP